MSTPKISVVIPCYNIEKYVKAALASLENQSLKNFEALVVDDGSTDNTAKIIKSFCNCDSRFKLLEKPHGGLASARNYGIYHAVAEYIALLDGDDIYGSEKLANHFAWLKSSPKIGVVYSASQIIQDDGTPTFMYMSGKPIMQDPLAALVCKNFIGHGSNAVFRRCIIDEVGDFDGNFPGCEDLDFWLRIAATRKWLFFREPTVQCFYRIRSSGLSFKVQEMENIYLRVIDSAFKRNPELTNNLLKTAYAYMSRYISRLYLMAGDIDLAKKYINRSINYDRTIFLKDWRSLLTLISVNLAPLSKLMVK